MENSRNIYSPMSLKDWIVTILLMIIPIVNIVLLFVWAFSDNTNISKKNWAKAQLIFIAISIVLSFFLGGYFVSLISKVQV